MCPMTCGPGRTSSSALLLPVIVGLAATARMADTGSILPSVLGSSFQDVDWAAVEAIATAVAVLVAAIAGLFAYRTWRDASATLKAQQEMLRIEQERWAEERYEHLAVTRRTAASLTIDTDVASGEDGGLLMRIRNEADVPFEDIVVEADPDHPQLDERTAGFGYLISALQPGGAYEPPISLPTGLWWRVRYRDMGGRQWARTPAGEFPFRID